MKNDIIIITGMPRSGTSMVAGIIDICGAYGGKLAEANEFNKKGMFENTYIREELIKPFMRLLCPGKKTQRIFPDLLDEHILKLMRLYASEFRRDIHQNLAYDFGYEKAPSYTNGPKLASDFENKITYYKDPKACLIYPLFNYAFHPNIKWVVVRRNTAGIIESHNRTDFMDAQPDDLCLKRWIHYHEYIFSTMYLDCRPMWQISSEAIIEGKFTQMKQLISELGLEWDQKAVEEFVEPELWDSKESKSE